MPTSQPTMTFTERMQQIGDWYHPATFTFRAERTGPYCTLELSYGQGQIVSASFVGITRIGVWMDVLVAEAESELGLRAPDAQDADSDQGETLTAEVHHG